MTSELLLWLALGACAGKPPSPVDETGVPDTPPDTDTGGSVDSGARGSSPDSSEDTGGTPTARRGLGKLS